MAVLMKPLMLKDFLELNENADSCNGPNVTSVTVRSLLEAEFVRSHRSKGTLTKISNAISNIVKSLAIPSPTKTKRSGLSKTKRSGLSKKVAAGRRRSAKEEGEANVADNDKVRVKDIVRLNSFEMYSERRSLYFPDPPYLASSCSTCSMSSSRHSSSSAADLLLSSTSSSSIDCPEYLGEAVGRDIASSHSPTPTRKIAGVADAALLSGHNQETKEIMKNKELECCGYQSEEETEQLSPVSVMNFPFQQEEDNDADENENENEECFEKNLAKIEKTRHKLLQNIGRFESLAALEPVDLAESFTNFEDHLEDHHEKDMTESGLIERLRLVGPHKMLLTDFFEEERTWTDNVEELLISAQNWILDGHLMDNHHGKVQIKHVERNGRWRCFEDEKEDLEADMGVRILGSLVEDLVLDLLS